MLAALARRFGLVAVVSGRPVAFLLEALDHPHGVAMAGLYGMEAASPGGAVETRPDAAAWRPVVDEVTRLAQAEAAPGAEVEPKGLTVTLHWRRHPAAEGWARTFCERATARTGLVVQPGRMALELRPPVADDKGTVVRAMARGHAAVACFGDDLGDLPAFGALAELAGTGVAVARVAVVDPESPPEVALAADLVVDGPRGCARPPGPPGRGLLRSQAGGAGRGKHVGQPGFGGAGRHRLAQPGGTLGPFPVAHAQGPVERPRRLGDVEGVDLDDGAPQLLVGAGLAARAPPPRRRRSPAAPPWPPGSCRRGPGSPAARRSG